MPLRLDIKKKLSTRTDRVKSVDLHPSEPWVLIGLYTGHLQIWNYETQQLVKSFEVVDQTPIRFAKFITRKQWIVCGSDDMMVRVFNINTMEKLREFEAHMDYIRSLEIHPVHPYVLTSSDDMQIKLWDWEKQWQNIQNFDGHSHYVMMVKFNPKDTNTFASASLDRSVKVWSLGNPLPNFSLEGHQAGVNCVDYFPQGDKPYIASGSDDHTVKIWDYQTKTCVYTLQSHTNNVSAVLFHPSLPIIMSGSEDGTVRVWHSTTYRLEQTLNYGMERCWTLSGNATFSNKIACGYDEGLVVLQIGREMPVTSMDKTGKLLLATAKDIQQGRVSASSQEEKVEDGAILEIAFKSACALENHLISLEHNLNGRFVAAVGDGEYVIYTSQALRNKSFGQGLELVWSSRGSNDFAVRTDGNKIKIFHDFKEVITTAPSAGQAEQIFGGNLIGVACSDGSLSFHSWQTGKELVKVQIKPDRVIWNESGDYVALCAEESFFILQVDQAQLEDLSARNENCEKCFDYLDEVSDRVKNGGEWIANDCFLYTNAQNRLNYFVGGETFTVAHLDREQILLGFLPGGRVYLMDKQRAVTSYGLNESVLRYQTAVCRGQYAQANELLREIPRSQLSRIARFLEAKNLKEAALQVAIDPEHKFELCLQLDKFSQALEVLQKEIVPQSLSAKENEVKWKQLGDLALSRGNVSLAEECALQARDLPSLLLIYSSTGSKDKLDALTAMAIESGETNTAFTSALMCTDYSSAIDVLVKARRYPEASFVAVNFLPQRTSECVQLWKKELMQSGHGLSLRIAKALADPGDRPDLFPGFEEKLAISARTARAAPAAPQQRAAAAAISPKAASPKAISPKAAAVSPRAAAEEPKAASPRAVAEPEKRQMEAPAAVAEPPAHKPAPLVAPVDMSAVDAEFAALKADEMLSEAVADDAAAQSKQQPAPAVAAPPSTVVIQEETTDDADLDDDDLADQIEAEVGGGEDLAAGGGEEEEEDLALEEDWE